jgi:mannitol PTS system EIICBA or EIICB component
VIDVRTELAPEAGAKERIQRVGDFLAGMVMPNIAAFIAWGLITAVFVSGGWWPNNTIAALVQPTVQMLLPVLIGATGGRMVHGNRGAVVGAVATIGVVVGSDSPMFFGAMVFGPVAAYLLKLADGALARFARGGFEMLVENFTAGILAAIMAIIGLKTVGPVMQQFTNVTETAVRALVHYHLLPLASLLIEPGKVLFLNNAINHGILAPIGAAESAATGKSILFMMETNPGPGLGILLAYQFFGPRMLRPSVPAAMVIHFLGGIHEIYFPYVLMKPRLIVAAIAGGATGIATFMVTGAGLVATPSPGSIVSYMAVTPHGGWFGVAAGLLASAVVSFVVAAVLLNFGQLDDEDVTR